MKIKFLMIGLLGLVSATAFAQKGALKDADENYTNYTVEVGQKLLAAKAKTDIADAKTAIDKAAANDKTATMAQTYALKGAIYGALAAQDTIAATAAPLLATAQEAIKKAKDADTKGEYKKLIDQANTYLAIYYQGLGVKQYQTAKYELAYQSFDNWAQATGDTTAVYYAGLSASNAGVGNGKFYPLAIADYNKLLATNFSHNDKIYGYLASIYMLTKDTTDAMKILATGIEKYPKSANLQELQVQVALQAGKENQVLATVEAAIANDPKNKLLYYYAGLTYTKIADADQDKEAKAKDAAAKAALDKSAMDGYAKAQDYYKKALAVDPDYIDANLNLGYVLMKPAIDAYNEARNLPGTASQKQYEDTFQKADALADQAKPYLQNAADKNPKSKEALSNLKNYYLIKSGYANLKKDAANSAAYKAKIDDLTTQIHALN